MLAGQVAIITGSGQGIGAEAARMFANEGAKVVIADVDASQYLFSTLPGRHRYEEALNEIVISNIRAAS